MSRSHSRANYDHALRGIHTVNYVTNNIVHRPWEETEERYGSINDNSDKYYGVKGFKRVANWKIVLACVVFCLMGIIVQILAITKSVTFNREKLNERSTIFSSIHRTTREEALKHNNKSNLERVVNRMKETAEK